MVLEMEEVTFSYSLILYDRHDRRISFWLSVDGHVVKEQSDFAPPVAIVRVLPVYFVCCFVRWGSSRVD